MTANSTLDRHLARTCWHLVAHRCELAADRDFARIQWPMGDLVLYNDKGSVIAFDNICPHRGARFFLESAGHAPALCAYHGWSYSGGKLRVPKPETYRPCDLAAARLHQYRIAWCGDFLFASVEPDSDLARQLGGTWPLLAGISGDIVSPHDLNTSRLDCRWQVAVENALEPDHVHMVHADTLGQLDLAHAKNRYFGRNSLLTAEIGNPRHVRALNAMARFFDIPHQHRGYFALHIFPFAFLTSTFGYTYALQTFMPGANSAETHLRSRMLTARTTVPAEVTEQFFASAARVNRQVFAEDHDICRRIDPAFPLHATGILSETEEKIRHIRTALAAYERHGEVIAA